MTKIGRPKVDSPKNIYIKVRIDKDTNEKLLKYCKDNNLSKAKAIRKGIEIRQYFIECEKQYYSLAKKENKKE